jgi:hypothetical protein
VLDKPIKILDIGGRETYWKQLGFTDPNLVRITMVNKEPVTSTLPNFTFLSADAAELPFPDKSFDIAFSNSTIEHVGNFERQRLFAKEVERVGKRYFVQTPNMFFPIEPHFVFPLFQFLPTMVQIWLLTHFALGNFPRLPNATIAKEEIDGVALLSEKQMKELFPGARVYREKLLGLTKSITVYKGFDE